MNKPKAKTVHVVFPGGDATRPQLHIRMTDCGSRLVKVSEKPSNKFLNSIVGQTDEVMSKRFGPAFRGWRKKNG